MRLRSRATALMVVVLVAVTACSTPSSDVPETSTPPATTTPTAASTSVPEHPPVTAGNPDGHAPIPPEAAAEDTSHPTRVIGAGDPTGCTSDAVVAAVAAGGIITFDWENVPLDSLQQR